MGLLPREREKVPPERSEGADEGNRIGDALAIWTALGFRNLQRATYFVSSLYISSTFGCAKFWKAKLL